MTNWRSKVIFVAIELQPSLYGDVASYAFEKECFILHEQLFQIVREVIVRLYVTPDDPRSLCTITRTDAAEI